MSKSFNKSVRTICGQLARFAITRNGFLTLTAAVMTLFGSTASRADFFDWRQATAPINGAYTPVIALTNSNVAVVQAFLTAHPGIHAIKIDSGVVLTQATINTIYNGFTIKYTFADFEGPNAVAQTTTLVGQIATTSTGANVAAGTAFIGNYALAPIPGVDPTGPGNSTYAAGNSGVNPFTTSTDFRNTGVNMATESLYPGEASFRNPVNNNSSAPNIRSAMFTLPIQRLSIATQNLGINQINFPYVSRFNNFANPTLSNTTRPRTDASGNQPAFDTSLPITSTVNGVTTTSNANSAGQLLSRNDFQALIAHYRMRGAAGYQLLDPGVVDYAGPGSTVAQNVTAYEGDALAGWNNSVIGGVLGGTNGRVATLPSVITFNSVKQTMEQAGVVWSAVTNDLSSTSGPAELAILISNLSPTAGTVAFNTRINGATLSYTAGVPAGGHQLLKFSRNNSGLWGSPTVNAPVFNDPSVAMASRDGIGIPEPTSLSLLGIGASRRST
jgi:hypothetical protein